MGQIKSALELALERTKDIQSDPAALRAHNARTEGKKLYAKLRDDRSFDVAAAIKTHNESVRGSVREGLFETALANLNLPQDEIDLESLPLVFAALGSVISDSRTLKTLHTQLETFLKQYIQDRTQMIEELRRQYAPRLRQREQQIAQQTGQRVRLDAASDPEFAKVLQSNMARLQQHYKSALDQVRDTLTELFHASR